ncbi:MAG: NAD(P)/FAD-dependent oxidoreductase [Inquilinaceae bacterium]
MKIAVIGTGISGLGAAFLLERAGHLAAVYERDSRIGGHSNTVDAPGPDGKPIPVDTGFIVFNEKTYPNLIALFGHLRVATEQSDMSFAVSMEGGRLEYSGSGIPALFAQRRNLLRPGHYGMLRDITRFYRTAPSLLTGRDPVSLGAYLKAEGYGPEFVYNHLMPMGAAIWSSTVEEMMSFPARSFVRFFANHGLLQVRDRPKWRTVTGGSRAYVARLSAPFADRIRAGCPAVSVRRDPGGVTVRDGAGEEERFDHVVIATQADQALDLLTDADAQENAVLGAFRYQDNRAVLHGDPLLMPRRRRAWASWNYLADRRGAEQTSVSLTYWMNRLQNLPGPPLLVSLNPLTAPDPDRLFGTFAYRHPLFDAAALDAQARIGALQGRRRTWFCGSYCGYGFHEDGLSAGLAVAEALGGNRPWVTTDASPAGLNATPDGSAGREAAA